MERVTLSLKDFFGAAFCFTSCFLIGSSDWDFCLAGVFGGWTTLVGFSATIARAADISRCVGNSSGYRMRAFATAICSSGNDLFTVPVAKYSCNTASPRAFADHPIWAFVIRAAGILTVAKRTGHVSEKEGTVIGDSKESRSRTAAQPLIAHVNS